MRATPTPTALIRICLLLALCVAACDGPSPTPPSTNNSEPEPTAVTQPTKQGRPQTDSLSSGDAVLAMQGVDYRALSTLDGVLPTGRTMAVVAVAQDGILVAVESEPVVGTAIPEQSLLLIDPVTRQAIDVPAVRPRRPEPARQVDGAVATKRWVVWKETASTDLQTDDWVLFSYDRQSKVTRRIATAPRTLSGVIPLAPGYTVPSLGADGRVYLTVVEEIAGRRYENYVESVRVDGRGGLRRETVGIATMASGNDLVWDESKPDRVVIWRRNLQTGEEARLFDSADTPCDGFSGLGVAEGTVAWLLNCPGQDRVVILHGGRTIVIQGRDLGYLEVTTDYVAFAPELAIGGYRQIVYDLESSKLLRVGAGRLGGEIIGGGDIMVWRSYPKSSRIFGVSNVVKLAD